MNSNDNTVQQVNYNFVGNPFSWTPNRPGSLNPSGATEMPNVISECQNEIRNRALTRYGSANVDFRDMAKKWWEGNTQRVNGRATVNSGRRTATIDYNCTLGAIASIGRTSVSSPVRCRRPAIGKRIPFLWNLALVVC